MMKVLWSPVLFILALAAGCQSNPSSPEAASAGNPDSAGKPDSAAKQNSATPPSGFLGDYSQLQKATDREGVSIFIDRAGDYRRYTKIMFDPTQYYVTPNPEYPEVPRDQL